MARCALARFVDGANPATKRVNKLAISLLLGRVAAIVVVAFTGRCRFVS